MGKAKRQRKEKEALSKKHTYKVSVCTPTFNRRPFIKNLISCFTSQDYPMDYMEWIVVDDGTDKVKDLFDEIDNVKYFALDEKMPLGKKRNFMHTKATGDIIVYMDDDDYYPPCRVSHAVSRLTSSPKALCAGSSELYVYFNEINKMYQFGPYGPNHATAGTFAFWKKLLDDTAYDDTQCLAEEKKFLKDYTVPFVQLDPMRTILVFSHEHNTFDKRRLLINPDPQFVRESAKPISMFVKNQQAKRFFMKEMDEALKNYPEGAPDQKPDVLEQIERIDKERQTQANSSGSIIVQKRGSNEKISLDLSGAAELLRNQNSEIEHLSKVLMKCQTEIAMLEETIQTYKNQCNTKCNDTECNDTKCNDTKCNDTECNDTKCNDTECNDTKCNDTECNDTECNDTECNDTECNDTECNDTECNDTECNDTECKETDSDSKEKYIDDTAWETV